MKQTSLAAGTGTSTKIAGGFKCRLCEEKFPSDEERKQHYVSAHPGEKVTLIHQKDVLYSEGRGSKCTDS